jgi:protein-L-isoaspartate(D-aspartate) O-methyltransferase
MPRTAFDSTLAAGQGRYNVFPMYRFVAALLCFIVTLPACSSADSDLRPHPDDQQEETAMRANLAKEIRKRVQATASETGVEDLDDGIVAAIAEVPRHAFVPPPLRPFAYLDIPLPITRDQNIAQPSLMALMTQLARIGKDDVVFETGTDSGYHAAILARLAKKVYSVEIIAPLAAQAKERLKRLGYNGIEVQASDGFYGWAEKGPFDVIIIKEAVQDVPPPLLNQLKPGGRLVAPIGPLDQGQTLKLITKDRNGRIRERGVLPVRFSPLQGGERI